MTVTATGGLGKLKPSIAGNGAGGATSSSGDRSTDMSDAKPNEHAMPISAGCMRSRSVKAFTRIISASIAFIVKQAWPCDAVGERRYASENGQIWVNICAKRSYVTSYLAVRPAGQHWQLILKIARRHCTDACLAQQMVKIFEFDGSGCCISCL